MQCVLYAMRYACFAVAVFSSEGSRVLQFNKQVKSDANAYVEQHLSHRHYDFFVIMTTGTYGDFNPALSIALRLASSGHNVVFTTNPSFREAVQSMMGIQPHVKRGMGQAPEYSCSDGGRFPNCELSTERLESFGFRYWHFAKDGNLGQGGRLDVYIPQLEEEHQVAGYTMEYSAYKMQDSPLEDATRYHKFLRCHHAWISLLTTVIPEKPRTFIVASFHPENLLTKYYKLANVDALLNSDAPWNWLKVMGDSGCKRDAHRFYALSKYVVSDRLLAPPQQGWTELSRNELQTFRNKAPPHLDDVRLKHESYDGKMTDYMWEDPRYWTRLRSFDNANCMGYIPPPPHVEALPQSVIEFLSKPQGEEIKNICIAMSAFKTGLAEVQTVFERLITEWQAAAETYFSIRVFCIGCGAPSANINRSTWMNFLGRISFDSLFPRCDLILSGSGVGTLYSVYLSGTPAIPLSTHGEQHKNAFKFKENVGTPNVNMLSHASIDNMASRLPEILTHLNVYRERVHRIGRLIKSESQHTLRLAEQWAVKAAKDLPGDPTDTTTTTQTTTTTTTTTTTMTG